MNKLRYTLPIVMAMLAVGSAAQNIVPASAVSAGGHGGSGAMLSWSVGQPVSTTFSNGSMITSGIQQPDRVEVQLNIKVFLGGPYQSSVGLMADQLRTQGSIPSLEPYTALGFQHKGGGGGESIAPSVISAGGNDAIVDWLFLELRSNMDPQTVLSTASALVQRDGDVVAVDGLSSVRISAVPGSYHLTVRHRNHLPIMTAQPVALQALPSQFDLTDGTIATYGTNAQRMDGNVLVLWPGDTDGNHLVKYSGSLNDRTVILNVVGASTFLSPLAGYYRADVNMNGMVSYSGSSNDRSVILNSVGAATFLSPRAAQLP